MAPTGLVGQFRIADRHLADNLVGDFGKGGCDRSFVVEFYRDARIATFANGLHQRISPRNGTFSSSANFRSLLPKM